MTALMLFTTAWVCGILLSHIASVPLPWLLLAIPAALVLVIGWGDARWARRGAAIVCAFLLGAWRLALAQPTIDESHIAFYVRNDSVIVEGVLIGEGESNSTRPVVKMKAHTLTINDAEKKSVDGNVLVTFPPYSDVNYGERVQVAGLLKIPPDFENYSYRTFLAHQNIYAVLDAKNYNVITTHQANVVKEWLLFFKTHAHQILLQLYPEPQAALLSGILLGIDSGIPAALEDAFNTTGTGHIVAISGFNLSIVAGGFALLTRRLFLKRGKTIAALVGLWLYVVLVGASAVVLRAGVMSTLGIIAVHERRKVHGPTALAAAVLVLTMINPYTLWDVGFQLSFTATLGMVLYTQPLEHFLQVALENWLKPERAASIVKWCSESLLVTIAAQLVTVGVTVSTFQRLSLVSLLTNALILPVQVYIMLFGGISLLVGLVFQPLAQLIAWIAWVFLAYTTSVVQLLARLPKAAIALGNGTFPVIVTYYVLLACLTWWFRSKPDDKQRLRDWVKQVNVAVIFTLLAVIALIISASLAAPDGKLHVVFLNVGSGEAIFIRTPHGQQLLIDGGEDGAKTLAEIGRQMPFWDRSLDIMITTSSDSAHLAGLIAVLERYKISNVMMGTETPTGNLKGEWEQHLQTHLADRKSDATLSTTAGDHWILEDNITLDILWPPENIQGPLVLQFCYGNSCILLPGGATTVIEEAMVAYYEKTLSSQVMLLPRHGASTAATPAFLQAVNPEVVVATGADPVSPYVLARLGETELYSIEYHGTVEFIFTSQTYKIKTTRE